MLGFGCGTDLYETGTTLTNTFTFGVAIAAPADDLHDIAAGTEDLEAADFLVVTQPTGNRAGLATSSVVGYLTRHTTIGLVAEIDVSYVEPLFASRTLATLDLISAGRAGWQLKVDTSHEAARRRGLTRGLRPDELVDRVDEYTTIVRDLWDSWDSNAIVRDRARGIYLSAERVHHLNHVGPYFSVRGPAVLARPPQGHLPTFVGLTSDPHTRRLAGAVGEVIRLRSTSADQVGTVREEYPAARVLVDIPYFGLSETLAVVDQTSPAAHGIVVELTAQELRSRPLRAIAQAISERGLRSSPVRGSTLRDTLALPTPLSRFAVQETS